MSNEGASKPSIKVTDRRLFTDDGDLRDPSALEKSVPSPGPAAPKAEAKPEPEPQPSAEEPDAGELDNPGTMFTSFVDSLVVNAYMALGMVRHPYRNEQEIDVEGARQMIDILQMLTEKTKGNLTQGESRYLATHLGELKLAFVRRSQSIK